MSIQYVKGKVDIYRYDVVDLGLIPFFSYKLNG